MSTKNLNKKLDGFKAILGFIADPVVVVDSSGQILAANNILGKYSQPASDLVNKNISELQLFDEKHAFMIKENLSKRLQGDQIEPYEVKMKSKDGKDVLLEINAKKIEYEGEELDVIVLRDVTKRAETTNRVEEKFTGIALSVKDALVLVDEEAKITYWNPAAETIFGYNSKEAVGKVIHELVVPRIMNEIAEERIRESVKAFSETGIGYFTVGNVEIIARRKNGSEFPAELSVSPMKAGDKWHAVAVIKDISARKQANQRLQEAEQRYHMLFSQAPLGVIVVDSETLRFAEFNENAHLQLGYTREEFEKITLLDIQAELTPDQVKECVKEIIKNNSCEHQVVYKTKTGEKRDEIVTCKAIDSNGKTYLHCIAHDITENRKTQDALVESEARFRHFVEVAQEGIWVIDNDFFTTFVNPHMAEMLGYKETEILGKKLTDFLDADWVEKISGIIQGFTTNSIRNQYEYAFPHKNGGHVHTIVTLSIVTDAENHKIGTLAVVSDITQRKHAEQALRTSEELSKAIVANAPIGIATSDSTYHFVSANEAFCEILGYSEAELQKLTFKEISLPEELEKSIRNIKILENGENATFAEEKRYLRKDGRVIIGKVVVSAIRNPKGKPTLFVVKLEDITKRKQLEEELRASEERFRAISTSAMDAIILSDDKDHILYWNPAAEKMYGYPSNEAIGKKLAELIIPPEVQNKHSQLLSRLGDKPISKREFGLTGVRKDCSTFPVDLSIVSVKLQDQNCLLAIVKDITEWKAMEAKLKQERDILERVTTSTNILLAIIDRDYKITWANKKAEATTDYANFEGRYCYEAFGNNSQKVCEGCGVKRVYDNGENIVRRDYYNPVNNRWSELVTTPIKDKDGKVIAALEIAIDINERKQLQNKLAGYSQKLEEIVQKRTGELKKTQAELVKSERLAAIGELAGMIGHDLRNPLTGIKNSAYFLKKKGYELPPEQNREMLDTIDKCVDYSNRIINDLLDYSREIHLILEKTSPKNILEESLKLINLPEKIQITNQLNESPIMQVDPDKIKRVFINLIKNAVEAMPEGGKIIVNAREVKDNIEIFFSDTGVGISDEALPKLFAPLFTTKAQGMGFGLAICKRIIEAHKGSIVVKSVKGQGTTFTLTLPLNPKIEKGGE